MLSSGSKKIAQKKGVGDTGPTPLYALWKLAAYKLFFILHTTNTECIISAIDKFVPSIAVTISHK